MKTMIVKVYPNESVPPAVECDCDVNCNGLMINVTFTNLVITAEYDDKGCIDDDCMN